MDMRTPNRRDAAAMRDYRARLYWWTAEYKARNGCTGPGPHTGKLTFHHRDPSTKEEAVSNLVGKGKSFRRVLAEVQKCDVLCEACHKRLEQAVHAAPCDGDTDTRSEVAS